MQKNNVHFTSDRTGKSLQLKDQQNFEAGGSFTCTSSDFSMPKVACE